MYRRYSHTGGEGLSLSQIKRNRIKDVLILILAAAVIVLAVLTIRSLRQQGATHEQFIAMMQNECSRAADEAKGLSRTGGMDSYAMLARIRSNLYAIRKLNDIYNAQNGSYLIPDEEVLTIQNMVDRYMEYLNKGMDTGEYQSSLQNALAQLLDRLGTIQ